MWGAVVGLLLGVLTWSLAEYCVHRWLGHNRKWIKNPFGHEHTAHHSRGNYFAPAWKKLLVAGLAVVVTIGPAVLVAGFQAGLAWVTGFVGFYLYYEVLHRLEHVHQGWGAYGRWARTHHFHHHFHNPKVNHGVTSPVWDLVFGTYQKPGVIKVPVKLQMPWLVNPDTAEVWAHLSDRYQLLRPRSRSGKRARGGPGVPPRPLASPHSSSSSSSNNSSGDGDGFQQESQVGTMEVAS